MDEVSIDRGRNLRRLIPLNRINLGKSRRCARYIQIVYVHNIHIYIDTLHIKL